MVITADDDGRSLRTPQERSTRQKAALAAVLEASDGFRSAQELHTLLDQGENVALTTVYNQVRALADAGELDALRSDDGETRYRRCASGEHHHHLVCRHCGVAIEVEGPEVKHLGHQDREGQWVRRCDPYRRNYWHLSQFRVSPLILPDRGIERTIPRQNAASRSDAGPAIPNFKPVDLGFRVRSEWPSCPL